MHRFMLVMMGVLELGVAGVLANLAMELPAPADIDDSFTRAERVTDKAAKQVGLFREQLDELRSAELHRHARGLEEQTRKVTGLLRAQKVDYGSIETMRDALRDVSTGLDSLSKTLDPKAVEAIGKGLRSSADFLDKQVVPAAKESSGELDKLSKALADDARQLAKLLREVPLDLKAARRVHDSLGKFAAGLEQMKGNLKLDRVDKMKEGFRGLETALTTGARQVERLADYSYPVVTFEGFRPVVDERSFWPDGATIAKGMRKASEGAKAAGEELGRMSEDLPRMRAAIAESHKVLLETRTTIGAALEQQDKIEPLLKRVPERIGTLAEELPKLTDGLAKILRETTHLEEVAKALRATDKELTAAVKRWPELQGTLSRSSVLLRATSNELDMALENRDEYESAMKQMVLLADVLGALLPSMTAQFETHVARQDEGLADLEESIDEFSGVIPHYARTTSQMVQTGRWLLCLLAAMAAVHGLYLGAAGMKQTPRVAAPRALN